MTLEELEAKLILFSNKLEFFEKKSPDMNGQDWANFTKLLLDSLIECLQDWHNGISTKAWPAWAWRILFNVRKDARLLIKPL